MAGLMGFDILVFAHSAVCIWDQIKQTASGKNEDIRPDLLETRLLKGLSDLRLKTKQSKISGQEEIF